MSHLQKLIYLYYTHYSYYEIQIRHRKDYYYFWIYIVIVVVMEPTTDKLMLVFNIINRKKIMALLLIDTIMIVDYQSYDKYHRISILTRKHTHSQTR